MPRHPTSERAPLISRNQFMALRHGDVVKFVGKRGRVWFRTIMHGPADTEPPCTAVEFPISRRSWTGRVTTCYAWNDLKHKMVATGKRLKDAVASFDELERLYLAGFNIEAQMARELDPRNPGAISRPPVNSVNKCSAIWRGRVAKTLQIVKEVFPDQEAAA